MFELIFIIKCLLSVSRVFLTPAIKLSTQISKSKIVIRGTKARPPQGSLRRVVTPVKKRASLTLVAKRWIAGLG